MRKSQDLWVCTNKDEMIDILSRESWTAIHKPRSKVEYIDTTATLDIETTNTEDDGFLYSIALNIGGHDVVFRYVEDFLELMERLVIEYGLNEKRHLVIYVHNLGYEHMYLTQVLHEAWVKTDILLTKARKPLYIRFANGIELRDSLKLFQKSLARATEGLPHEKLKGDLDYTIYRTPDTPLSPDEWNYVVNDVQGLYEAIERLKAEHGYNQATIPYTNTGMVLEEVNKHIRRDLPTMNAIRKLRLKKHQLRLAYKAMAGGDTHGSRWKAGKTFADCNSADLKSAHPSQQLLKKFPSGEVIDLDPDTPVEDLEMLIDSGYGWIAKVIVTDFRCLPENPDPTISVSKCEQIDGRLGVDNGRLLGAEAASIYMDSNDWIRFREGYEYEDMIAVEAIAFRLEYLPEPFVMAIYDKFVIKESAEDGPDRVFAKICVNTIFGACAQKTVRDEYVLEESLETLDASRTKWEDNLEAMEEDKVLKTQNKKLPFLWGLWTSSLSRLDLWNLIKTAGWDRAIYWDTDSVKYEGAKVPEIETVFNAANHKRVLDRGRLVINRKGEEVYIGSAEDEHPDVAFGYRKFRFLHAKCYAAEAWNRKKGRYELETTIAGVGKKEGIQALNGNIDNLAEGLVIKDAGGLALAYHDAPVRVRSDFGRETVTASWIVMSPREYEIKSDLKDRRDILDMEILG